jgi:transcriptional regulator with XRE-family HTH domain
MRSKAEFRALREMAGLSQADVADALGVTVRSVRRWETPAPGYHGAPDDAWELLEDAIARQMATVEGSLDVVNGLPDAPVQLTYYRNQAQFDAYGREPGTPYGAANANTRLVAFELMRRGVEVEFSYPDDADNIYHGAKSS